MEMDEQIWEKLHFVMQMWRKFKKGKINYFENLGSSYRCSQVFFKV